VEVVAGTPLTDPELRQARAALAERRSVGLRLHQGHLEIAGAGRHVRGIVVLSGGAAVIRLPARPLSAERRRLLSALLGLASLLLDRHRSAAVAERAVELEASDRLKAAVLSSISHELRSPLASLRAGLTTLLMPQAGLGAEQRELLDGLDRQATRLDRLVGDLLTMSRLEAGLPPDRRPQDLEELVGTVLQGLAGRLAGAEVRLDLAPDLPAVLGDELQVERVLTNLLENAVEWTPAGGRITVGARADDGWVEAWVENEGPQITAGAICRRIVEAHGGRIQAENRPDGPRFAFRLPAAAERVGAG